MLHSGVTPPNPAELLANGHFDDLLVYGKKHYDYVIVDTAPVKLVTDTFLLGKNADLCIYTIRSNYLDKRMLEIPAKLYKDKRLSNMSILLNGADLEVGYGRYGSYGSSVSYGSYGYGDDVEKPWWKTIFKKS